MGGSEYHRGDESRGVGMNRYWLLMGCVLVFCATGAAFAFAGHPWLGFIIVLLACGLQVKGE